MPERPRTRTPRHTITSASSACGSSPGASSGTDCLTLSERLKVARMEYRILLLEGPWEEPNPEAERRILRGLMGTFDEFSSALA